MSFEKNVSPRGDVSLTKHGLRIPVDATSYDEFVSKIRVNEEHFLSNIVGSKHGLMHL